MNVLSHILLSKYSVIGNINGKKQVGNIYIFCISIFRKARPFFLGVLHTNDLVKLII